MTSSMLVASIPERSPTALTAIAARSSARTLASAPPCLPTGVRRAAQTKASRVTFPVSRFPFPGFSQAHPYRLRLRIVVQRLLAQITPEPRELVAAKRGGGVVEVVRIDPHRARLDRAGHAVRFLHVLGPDARREAVARAVGELDALRLALEREHRQYRSEDFFVHDLHAGCGAVEHGRLDVEALAVDLGRLAAGHEPGAILRSRGDVGEHRLLLPLGHDRPEPGVLVERVAGHELLGPLGELLHHLVVHAALDQETGSGGADLSLSVEDRALGAADRGGQVRIREDDVGTLAAELERDPFHGARGLTLDPLADLGGPGEGDLVHQR